MKPVGGRLRQPRRMMAFALALVIHASVVCVGASIASLPAAPQVERVLLTAVIAHDEGRRPLPPVVDLSPPPQLDMPVARVMSPPMIGEVALAPVAVAPVQRAARVDLSACDRPSYPVAASSAKVSGLSQVRVTVDPDGRVLDAQVEQSAGPSPEHQLLDAALLDALRTCRFSPAIGVDGGPTGGTVLVSYAWRSD